MPTALLKSGVRSVLAAQWEVADVSTALLVRRFWRAHVVDGEDPVTALDTAQGWLSAATSVEMIRELERDVRGRKLSQAQADLLIGALAEHAPDLKPFHDPYYWAGFIVYGF
jgi:CHAT domain-containing protein